VNEAEKDAIEAEVAAVLNKIGALMLVERPSFLVALNVAVRMLGDTISAMEDDAEARDNAIVTALAAVYAVAHKGDEEVQSEPIEDRLGTLILSLLAAHRADTPTGLAGMASALFSGICKLAWETNQTVAQAAKVVTRKMDAMAAKQDEINAAEASTEGMTKQ